MISPLEIWRFSPPNPGMLISAVGRRVCVLEALLPAWLPFQDIESLIRWGGLVALFAIVFAETGLMVGFFLPGDSLLFTAGFLAAAGFFDFKILLFALIIAAFLGDQTGYVIGRWMGKRLFRKKDGRFFKQSYVTKTHRFYQKYGVSTIVLARFVPVVRTFAPVVAGVGKMRYRVFTAWNLVGGIGWVALMCDAGYFLGNVPWVQSNFGLVTILIIIASLIPLGVELWRARKDEMI
jgi:membrane-associated protein